MPLSQAPSEAASTERTIDVQGCCRYPVAGKRLLYRTELGPAGTLETNGLRAALDSRDHRPHG